MAGQKRNANASKEQNRQAVQNKGMDSADSAGGISDKKLSGPNRPSV
ncbi:MULTISPECIES: hypothetical protein [unclassified Paenibacillus]|nr:MULTISPECIES: hypothetical protein [unclassified Paenibacillus]MBP1157556.1 hypothetical protein [Paenibacillus sp. PvP091]MBP1171707.1 hypothetical protein [Paenibacillus sp. PvR098]MBP2438088.1 hypothetical protein [Paenibacillus sp. PvP052]